MKWQHLAAKCAPKKPVKDFELVLSDFINQPTETFKPCLFKTASFLEECHMFQLEPFALCPVPEENHLTIYNMHQA